MRNILAGAMVSTMALALLSGTLLYAAVRPDVGAPMAALVLVSSILYAAKLLLAGGATWKRSPMHWPVGLFLGYAIIRYFFSPFEHDARVELFQVIVCALAYFVAASQFYRPLDRGIILGAVVLLVIFESAYGLWQCTSRASKVWDWVRQDEYQLRAGGTFVCPNNLATFLELGLGLLLGYGLLAHLNQGHRGSRSATDRSLVMRLIVLYAALMAVVGIIATFSRAGWIATIAGMFIFSFWAKAGGRIPWSKFVGIGVVAAMMGFAAWKVEPVRNYILRKTLNPEAHAREDKVILRDPTLGGRVQMWKGSLQLVAANPVFGVGIGSWQWVYQKIKDPFIENHPEHAHNDILHVAADYGLIGFGLLVWLFIGFYRQAAALRDPALPSEQRGFAIGTAVAVSMALIHAWFDFPFHIPANSLLLALLMGCLAAMEDPRQRYPRRPMPAWGRYSLAGGISLIAVIGTWYYIPTARGVYLSEAGNIAKFQYVLNRDIPLELYRRAMEIDPKHPEPHWKTADIYRSQAVWLLGPDKAAERQRLVEASIPQYQRALELNPLLNEVLLRQAAAYEMIGRDSQALSNYLRAVEISPVNAFNHHVLGRYYRNHDDPDRAYHHFERAHALNNASDNSSQINMLELRPPDGRPPEETNAPAPRPPPP